MARKDDYIPANDVEFAAWLGTISNVLNAHLDDLGLKAEDVAFLTDAHADMQDRVERQKELEEALRALMGAKRSLRSSIEQSVRRLVMRIKYQPGLTNELRSEMKLTIPKGYRSRYDAGDEKPDLHLETVAGSVIVHFGTDPKNELLNGKPKWAQSCHIYRRKAGDTDYTLVADARKSPYYDEIEEDAVIVSYMAAYQASGTYRIGRCCPAQVIAAGRAGYAPPRASSRKAA